MWSDRAAAGFIAFVGVLFPLAFVGVIAIVDALTTRHPNPMFMFFFIPGLFSGVFILLLAAWMYARNRPVVGRDEDDTRRRIKRWYREAKKWMDEHPEDVEMKDL